MSDAAHMGNAGAGPSWFAQNANRIGQAGFAVALAGAIVAIAAGQGYQLGLWGVLQGFNVLRWGAYIAGAGLVLSVVAVCVSLAAHKGEFFSRSLFAICGLVIGLLAFGVPFVMQSAAAGIPPIHDITTDIDDPPQFVDAVPLRQAAHAVNNKATPNDEATPAYLREIQRGKNTLNIPALQQKAYPDIKPIVLSGTTPDQAFGRALAAAKAMNWHIIAAKADEGRIEAWDKTPWFGFVDDVVIRVRPEGSGSRIDVRSLSRIGGGDVGKNAKRIRAYIDTFNRQG